MKLRARLSLLAAVALVPMVIFSGVAAGHLIDALRDAAMRGMRETARANALIIDREIKGAISAVTALASSPYLASGDWRLFHEQAKLATAAEGGWLVLYSSDGQQVVNTRLPFGSPLLSRPDAKEVTHVIDNGVPRISGLVWAPTLKVNVVFVDVPVRLSNGARYVLSQVFHASYFNVAFSDRGIPPSWVSGIFDRQGVTIARSHMGAELVGTVAKAATVQALRLNRDSELKQVIRGGVEVNDVFTHSALSGWGVAVSVPAREIDTQVRRAVVIAGGGLVVALALAFAAAAFIGRRLARSIEDASTAAVAIGRHQSFTALPPSGTYEVDNLQHAITHAARLLHEERTARISAEAERLVLLRAEQAARKQAEAQSSAKDEFLAMLGHELRNPLSAITSATSLLERRSTDEASSRRAIGVLRRQSDHLRNIIDDLLDLSRVMAGKILLEKAPVDLGQMVTRCVEALEPAGLTAPYDFTVQADSITVHADPTRLEQIITNLIDNALKYTPAGGRISVSVSRAGHTGVLEVADSGIGISAELLPYIFDVFVQGDNSLARAKGGMGIGLSLVHKLVSLHGGAIRAHSPGKGMGSTFVVQFPLSTVEIATPRADAPTAIPAQYILLVEDQDDGREMMTALLEATGHRVLAVASGAEALDALRTIAEKPSVALLDIGLPGMDGYEIARRLRSDPATTHIRLIALTGYGLKEDKHRALGAGFDCHLTKPLKLDELNQCLKPLRNF